MRKRLVVLALLGLAFASGAVQSKDQQKASKKPPKGCFPILRIPPGDPTPPDGPIPYSVWYYTLYDQFCQGKSEDKCIWACAKKPADKSGGEKKDGD
jgi:hypothetical protein